MSADAALGTLLGFVLGAQFVAISLLALILKEVRS